MNWINRVPLRKPLAAMAAALLLLIFARSAYTGLDIPPNTAGVINVFIGVVLAGYFGSSAIETFAHKDDGK